MVNHMASVGTQQSLAKKIFNNKDGNDIEGTRSIQGTEDNQDPYRVQINKLSKDLNELKEDYSQLRTKIGEFKDTTDIFKKEMLSELRSSQIKSVESIGIISSIIGIGLGFVSVSKDQADVFTTVITLILTTAAFAIFATLIHLYFNDDQFVKKSKTVLHWAGATAAAMLILATIGQNGLSKLIYKIINPREPSQIILFNQLFSINKVDPSPSLLR